MLQGRIRIWTLLFIFCGLGTLLLRGVRSADPNNRSRIEFSNGEDEYECEYSGEEETRYEDDPDYYDRSSDYIRDGPSEAQWSLEFQSRMYIYFFAIFLFIFLLVTLAVGHFTWFRELQTKLEKEWLEQVRKEAVTAAVAEIERARSISSSISSRVSVFNEGKTSNDIYSSEDRKEMRFSPVIPTPVSLARPSSSTVSCGEVSDAAWDGLCDGMLCQPPHRHSILCSRNGHVPRLHEPIRMLGPASSSNDDDESEDIEEAHRSTVETKSYLEIRNAARTQNTAVSTASLPAILEPGMQGDSIYISNPQMLHNSMPDLEAPRPLRQSRSRKGSSGTAPFLDISKIDLI